MSVVIFYFVQITGCTSPGKTVSIVVRGSNKLVIEEAERSIHDALCVIRCLVKKRFVVLNTQFIPKKIKTSFQASVAENPPSKALLHCLILQERNIRRNSDA